MGTGTNVQKKLIAVHDLDIPWRPADLEQRAGRIIRQGNENKNVQIFRYVTKGTFDAYSYQTLENKQRFISQIMTSKTPARKCEDVDQQALTYSEIKALCTGDERIKEKLMLENDVKELRILAAEHRNTVFEMEDRIGRFPEQEQRVTTILDNLHTDREALRKLPIDPERKLPVFKITIGETEYTDRKEAAKALEDAVLAIKFADTPVKVGSFHPILNEDKTIQRQYFSILNYYCKKLFRITKYGKAVLNLYRSYFKIDRTTNGKRRLSTKLRVILLFDILHISGYNRSILIPVY